MNIRHLMTTTPSGSTIYVTLDPVARKKPRPSCKCQRCGHDWTPRIDTKPKRCPQCVAANWDRPARKGNYPRGADHPAKRKVTPA